MKSKISIKDIAKKAEISAGAVSFILNGRGDEMRISKKTQERVIKIAEEFNYQPNMAARRLRLSSESNMMSIMFSWEMERVVTTYSSTYLMTLMRTLAELEERFRLNNNKADFSLQPFLRNEFTKQMSSNDIKFYNAIFLGGISDNDFTELENMRLPSPVILLFRKSDIYHSIFADSYDVGYSIAELFHKKKFSSAGLVYSTLEMQPRKERRLGFIAGCRDFGIELKEENIIECGYSHQCGGEATVKLLETGSLPDGIFYLNNILAIGSLEVFNARNIRIPEDVQIITFDDSETLKYLRPQISVVDVTVNDMVEASLEVLWSVLERKNAGEILTRKLTPKFIFRDSFTAP